MLVYSLLTIRGIKKEREEGRKGGYARLAALADSLLKPGGTLVFASCSSRVSADDLFPVVHAHTHVRELARTGHAADHPALFPESHYLKCLYAEKLP